MTQPLESTIAPKPFIVDDGTSRRLQFSELDLQSEMRIADPYALTIPYTRLMMGFLLFQPYPCHIVIVGLGGGSLTKFCHRQLRTTRTTTLEVNHHIISFRELFHVPAPDVRTRIVHADAFDYFANTKEWMDVVLFDGCDAEGTAPVFCNADFYQRVRRRLRPGGLLAANVCGSRSLMDAHEHLIRDAFTDQVIVAPIQVETNRVAFAFNAPWRKPDWNSIRFNARQLARQHQLDFPHFADQLERCYQRSPAKRIG